MHIDMQPAPVDRGGGRGWTFDDGDEEATVGGKQQHQQDDSINSVIGRARGTVQHTYPERGFGFIRCTEGNRGDVGHDFFFHQSGLDDGLTMGELLPGSLVEFESREVPRGKRAEHVSLAR
jgi:cold shock CspA family protein